MPAIEILEKDWPVAVIRFTGTPTDAEFDAYLRRMSALLDRKEAVAMILDARSAGSTPPLHRKKQAEWLKANAARLRCYSAGTAFVIDSPLVRGALTAIFWLQPLPQEHTVVATREAADRWVEAQLRKRGIEVDLRR